MDKKLNKEQKRESWIQALKFLLFSCSAGIIETAAFALFSSVLKFSYWPAYLIALTLSVVWNFTLNREFTFKSAANIPVAMLKVIGYYAVFTPVSTVAGNYFADIVGVNDYIVLFVTMVINLVTEFLFDKFVVFRGEINTKGQRNHVSETNN